MLTQQVVNGLVIGTIYALLAVGISIAYSTTRIINFAHGEIFTAGAFVALTLQRKAGVPFSLACLASSALFFGIVFLFTYYILWHLKSPLQRSVATIALGLILRDAVLLAFGSDSASFLPVFPEGTLSILDINVPRSSLVIFAVTSLLLGASWVALRHTRLGLWMRATAQDEELASTSGISTRTMQATAFAVGATMAVLAGVLIGPTWQIHYAAGTTVGLKGFASAMIGGLGLVGGALAGGVLLGVAEAILSGYVSSAWKDSAVYLTFLIVLLFAPRGLFSLRGRRIG